jgi:hypothetical protein
MPCIYRAGQVRPAGCVLRILLEFREKGDDLIVRLVLDWGAVVRLS